MEKEHIGYLIKEIRETKKLIQSQLCRGLCNRLVLARIEQGQNNPDKILLDALFQRLGVSINKFGTSFSRIEYDYVMLRYKMIEVFLSGNYEKLKLLMNKYNKCYEKSSAKVLSTQFIALINILLEITKGINSNKIIILIQEALLLTGLELNNLKISNYVLHDEELILTMLLAENMYKRGDRNDAIKILSDLIIYIEKNIIDLEEMGRIYPMIAFSLTKKLLGEGKYDELYICERGIKILQENHKITFLPELLSLLLDGWHLKRNPKYHENKECYQTVINALEEFGIKKARGLMNILLLSNPIAQGHIIDEQIYLLRKILEMTQDDFYFISAKETISRIENGRKPTDKHYQKIMNRMGREGLRYYPFIKANEYALHIARSEMARYLVFEDYDKAEIELCLLERRLDRTEPINRQFLQRSRALIDAKKGLVSQEALLKILIEAINITKPRKYLDDRESMINSKTHRREITEDELINSLESWPLTQMETVIWNNIAITKSNLGDNDGKIRILSLIKKNYENRKISLIHNAKGYLLIVYNLSNELEKIGLYNESLKACNEGIEISILSGEGHILSGLLFIKANCMDGLSECKEACLKLYKQAFSLAEVLDYKIMHNYIKAYCEDKFKIDIKKYDF